MVSLIFGILALLIDVVAVLPLSIGYLGFVGFIFAIVAVATGNSVLRADPMDKSARVGKTIGTICIFFSILPIILWFWWVILPLGCVACTLL